MNVGYQHLARKSHSDRKRVLEGDHHRDRLSLELLKQIST